MSIIGDELLESIAQSLAHENSLVRVVDDGIEVRGADVWRRYPMSVEEVGDVMARVTELQGGSSHPR